jgi:hypothetical protein
VIIVIELVVMDVRAKTAKIKSKEWHVLFVQIMKDNTEAKDHPRCPAFKGLVTGTPQ